MRWSQVQASWRQYDTPYTRFRRVYYKTKGADGVYKAGSLMRPHHKWPCRTEIPGLRYTCTTCARNRDRARKHRACEQIQKYIIFCFSCTYIHVRDVCVCLYSWMNTYNVYYCAETNDKKVYLKCEETGKAYYWAFGYHGTCWMCGARHLVT